MRHLQVPRHGLVSPQTAPAKMLKKINPKNLEKFYKRKDEIERLEKEKKLDAMDK